MRIYEGSPRQDWEEVLRSVGAYLDARGMRDAVFLETDAGLIIQGQVVDRADTGAWGESMGQARKETLSVLDDDIAKFMEEAASRRGHPEPEGAAHRYEHELRVIGRYLDERRPRDLFFFEHDGAYVLRLLVVHTAGVKHELIEFTAEDIAEHMARGPSLRHSGAPAAPSPG